jgi:hypothetical protein
VSCLVVASARSAGPTRHDYIFYFTKNVYTYIYNLYFILKTFDDDVLLVKQLHLVSLILLPSGYEFKPHLMHNFLTFYADLIKWADGLTGWPDTINRLA